MATRYTVNGQEMSEDEFQRFQQENGFWNFGNRRQRRWDHKPHLYQCYKDTPPNRWNEISFDDFKKDFDKLPKFTKDIFYVQSVNKEYVIKYQPVVAIFYNHMQDIFLYMKADGLIEERNCFASEADAFAAIKRLENKKCGEHHLFSATGDHILSYFSDDINSSCSNIDEEL